MSDLRQRVPGHSLIEMLLRQWDAGVIHLDSHADSVVIDDDAISWYRGVIGERRVGSILDMLGEGHTVLHSVPVGAKMTDIDHVVVGRAGVFTINTKYSPGKKIWSAGFGLLVDGFKTRYVSNSIAEARRASELLSKASGLTVPVTALIVFVDPGHITRKAPVGGDDGDPDVRVIADRDLSRVFVDRPIFSEEQVARIANAAVLAETWHSAPTESTTGSHITREFEALEEAVGPHLARAYGDAQDATPRRTTPAPVSRGSRAPRTSRPAASRPRTGAPRRGRKRTSPVEKLIAGLILPAAMFFGAWFYLTSIAGT